MNQPNTTAVAPSIFPFYINPWDAERLITVDPKYVCPHFVTDLRFSGRLHENQVLELDAWAATDNGFCATASTFWEKEILVSKPEFIRLIQVELKAKALAQIEEEKARALSLQVSERVNVLVAEFDLADLLGQAAAQPVPVPKD